MYYLHCCRKSDQNQQQARKSVSKYHKEASLYITSPDHWKKSYSLWYTFWHKNLVTLFLCLPCFVQISTNAWRLELAVSFATTQKAHSCVLVPRTSWRPIRCARQKVPAIYEGKTLLTRQCNIVYVHVCAHKMHAPIIYNRLQGIISSISSTRRGPSGHCYHPCFHLPWWVGWGEEITIHLRSDHGAETWIKAREVLWWLKSLAGLVALRAKPQKPVLQGQKTKQS